MGVIELVVIDTFPIDAKFKYLQVYYRCLVNLRLRINEVRKADVNIKTIRGELS